MSDRLIVLMMVIASDVHSVLEAPHLHGRDLEVFRAQWLIIESIAVAGSPMVQVCIKVEGLAITTSYDDALIAASHEHGSSFGRQVEVTSS